MIVITFSLPEESRDFLRAIRRTGHRGSGVGSVVQGVVGPVPVTVWHIGVGAARATREAARMLTEARPTTVLCAGYGGALTPDAKLGEVVVDFRSSAGIALPVSCRQGRIHTAAHVAETAEEKRQLGEQTGALAVDMETAIVAAVFEPAGVRVIGIRAISDRMEDEVPVPMDRWFDLARQRPRVWALLGFLARHPRRVSPFAKFVRGLAPARRALAQALVELVPAVAPSGAEGNLEGTKAGN